MGKTMDKATVIYGADQKVNLTNINWEEMQTAILAQIGDEPIGTAIAGAKKAVDEAKKDKGLQKPYVKVGLVDGSLVMRIKDPRPLIDKELDTVLVRQFKQKKEAYQKMLGKTGGGSDKGVVVSLDPKDDVIKDAAKSISTQRKMGEDAPLRRMGEDYADKDKMHTGKAVDDEKLKEQPFSNSSDAPVVILAHGTPLGKVGSGKVHATEFGNKKPAEIIAYLKKSLPVTYSGVVYLDGCYTAAGNTPLNFAKQVYDGLVKAGYFYLQIKGNLGMARTVNGKECVTPAEIETAYEEARNEKKKLEEEQKTLAVPYDKAIGQTIDKENQIKFQARIAGRKTPDQFNDDEKKKLEQIDTVLKAIKIKRANDPKLGKIDKRIVELTAIMAKPEYNIEALTGTWGPEKLAPKK
jgi:hypothetical protein